MTKIMGLLMFFDILLYTLRSLIKMKSKLASFIQGFNVLIGFNFYVVMCRITNDSNAFVINHDWQMSKVPEHMQL